ncbi:MAG: hypothetical protein IPO95_06995 [Rhodanobacteraceae bacterium]|nr:hypothetical protein [Rhodanobacteraceae bacterium]MBP7624526.1 hypothetical protein [Xanthomonadales bacterium]
MFRPALSFVFASLALLASATVVAKTSVSSLQQSELPCPSNRSDAVELGEPAAAAATAPAVGNTVVTKPSNKAARQRWKALLPGTLKSAS